MRSILVAAALAAFALAAQAGQPVQLRAVVEARGPAVTLGDVFDGAGEAASRPIAPAPAPGERAAFSAGFVAAAAHAAGLDWTPPPGLAQIDVTRAAAGPARAAAARAFSQTGTTAAPAAFAPATFGAPTFPQAADFAIRRGDTVTLTFAAPGLRLTTRAKAQADARAGDPVKLVNLQSNRPVDAVATGPGAASANLDQKS